MDVKFVVNDYVLIWNLLFQASISESIYQLKQKLWVNYKDEYNNTYRDKNAILKDPKNFIPNDDTIYNIVLETKDYISLKREAEKYRLTLMKLWDSNKKKIERLVKRVLKIDLKQYTFFLELSFPFSSFTGVINANGIHASATISCTLISPPAFVLIH